jgi:hypothetical protein
MAPLQISAATAGHKFSTISSHVRVERNGGVAVEFATDSLAVFTDVAEKNDRFAGDRIWRKWSPYEAMFLLVNLDLIMVFKAY